MYKFIVQLRELTIYHYVVGQRNVADLLCIDLGPHFLAV